MCEQLGTEPDPARMPVSMDVFPEDVQYAFLIFNYMPDRWEGMSGSYMGKEWSSIDFFLNLFGIEDKKTVVFFISRTKKWKRRERLKNVKPKAVENSTPIMCKDNG